MRENTLHNPIRISNEDYIEIVNSGTKLLQSYSSSGSPIKSHYLSDIISFKPTFYNFVNQDWLICDSQSILQIRELMVVATIILG